MGEKWKAIVNYEGMYEVSSLGRVRSLLAKQGTHPGRILKPWRGRHQRSINGYRCVTFYTDHKPKVFYVHRLVAEAFLDLRQGLEVNHKNGDGTDNRLTNLEAVLPCVNKMHASTILHRWSGENHWNAKLTNGNVVAIRKSLLHYRRGDYRRIANKYGVKWGAIRAIAVGISWSHI